MLKEELEKKYNELYKESRKKEDIIRQLREEINELNDEVDTILKRERKILLNIAGQQFKERVNHEGPNGEKHEEIVIPDLEDGHYKQAKQRPRSVGEITLI